MLFASPLFLSLSAEDADKAGETPAEGTESGHGVPSVSHPVLSRSVFDTDLPVRRPATVLDLPVRRPTTVLDLPMPRPPPPVIYGPTSFTTPILNPSLAHMTLASDLSLSQLPPTQDAPLCRPTFGVDPCSSYLPPGLNPFLPRPPAALNPPSSRLSLASPQREDLHERSTHRSAARRTSPWTPQELQEHPSMRGPSGEAPRGAQEPHPGSTRDEVTDLERQDGQLLRVSPNKKIHRDTAEGFGETVRPVTKVAFEAAFSQGVTDLACDVTNTSFDVKPFTQSG